jgi:glycosyltransferase involved in cell wall biosynthesis
MAPGESIVRRLLASDPGKTVHIFSGVVHDREIRKLYRRAIASGRIVGILSEGRDWRGWKGNLRRIHAKFHETGIEPVFVLAIGRVGVDWYGRTGYCPTRIFPFCYAVETPERPVGAFLEDSTVRMIAIGQCIRRKRFDLLIEALARISATGWELRIIGDGALRRSLENIAQRKGLAGTVTFTGMMDNRRVREELWQSDLLLLPSRWDGWGAVVNEALMCGVPAICSDFCGAADLIRPGFNGDIFHCDVPESLVRVLERWTERGPLSVSRRDEILDWSRCINGSSVAQYFLDILRFLDGQASPRPVVPWKH